MRNWLRRLAGFSLVPLSLLPLGAIAPVVAPSVAKRVDVLQGVTPPTSPTPSAPPDLPALHDLSPFRPLASPGHDRRHARAATRAHHAKGHR